MVTIYSVGLEPKPSNVIWKIRITTIVTLRCLAEIWGEPYFLTQHILLLLNFPNLEWINFVLFFTLFIYDIIWFLIYGILKFTFNNFFLNLSLANFKEIASRSVFVWSDFFSISNIRKTKWKYHDQFEILSSQIFVFLETKKW